MRSNSHERGDVNSVDFTVFFKHFEATISKEFMHYWPEISWRVGQMTERETSLYKELKELLVDLFLTCSPNRRIDFAYLVVHSLLPNSKPYLDHVDVVSDVFKKYINLIGIRSPLTTVSPDALEKFTQFYVKIIAITYARMISATLRYNSTAIIIYQIALDRSEQYKTGTSYPRDIGDALLAFSSQLKENDDKVIDAERNTAKILALIYKHTGSLIKPVQPSRDVPNQIVIDGGTLTMNTSSLIELMAAKKTTTMITPSKLHAINRTLLGEVLDFKMMAEKEKLKSKAK